MDKVTATAPSHARAVHHHVTSPLTKPSGSLRAISWRIVDTID
ncbi:hypothetical protein [Streptomyces sp. NPDC017991]